MTLHSHLIFLSFSHRIVPWHVDERRCLTTYKSYTRGMPVRNSSSSRGKRPSAYPPRHHGKQLNDNNEHALCSFLPLWLCSLFFPYVFNLSICYTCIPNFTLLCVCVCVCVCVFWGGVGAQLAEKNSLHQALEAINSDPGLRAQMERSPVKQTVRRSLTFADANEG